MILEGSDLHSINLLDIGVILVHDIRHHASLL